MRLAGLLSNINFENNQHLQIKPNQKSYAAAFLFATRVRKG